MLYLLKDIRTGIGLGDEGYFQDTEKHKEGWEQQSPGNICLLLPIYAFAAIDFNYHIIVASLFSPLCTFY